jgi:branched-chain amino acid transport system ATP-binding protein
LADFYASLECAAGVLEQLSRQSVENLVKGSHCRTVSDNSLPSSSPHALTGVKDLQLEVVYHRVATAIQGVSLDVPTGSIVALVGTNGAGKTTTLRAISGFLPSEDANITDGEITFRGRRINGRMPHELARAGIILVPERDKVFATLDIKENLEFASREGGQITLDRIIGYFPRLAERQTQLAGYLSGGEKQMLAIGMALLCSPSLLLIDELSLGLAPIVIKELMERLRRVTKELGLTVLLVEQNANAALAISDFGYVMEGGRVVFSGNAMELMSHPDVREFYLGGSAQAKAKSYRDIKQYRRKRRWWG